MRNDRLTEQEALERLNLESFERLGKKDVIRLGSLLPQMQPEVAKKALEQFPEFARAVGGMMSEALNTQVEILGDYGAVLKSFELKAGDSVRVTLTENTALQISDGTCVLIAD